MKNIFISSSYEDLKGERDVMIKTLDQLEDTKVITMERFPAFPDVSKDYCIEQVQQSHAMILILGFSYGNIDPEEQISLTEIEYNTAKMQNIPVFAILKTNEFGKWEPKDEDAQKKKLLLKFKDRLSSDLGRRKFKNDVELISDVLISIQNYQTKHGEIGARIPPFLDGRDFFKSYMDRQKLLHHLHPFFGREQYIIQLDNFVNSDKQFAILYGHPTVGKSKILFEYCKRFPVTFPKKKLLFVRDNIILNEDSIPSLPTRIDVLIVVDDAHTRSDLNLLLEIAKKYSETIKFLFITRSYARKPLELQIYSSNFDSNDLEILPEVQPLSIPDLERLGKEILGSKYEHYLHPLLKITQDSTLFFVIGAKLLVDREVLPESLHNHDEFRRLLILRFKDILLGNIDSKFKSDHIQILLKLIAILSPIRPDDRDFQEQASRFLGIEKFIFIDLLSALEQAGVLIRRGYSLRITPDILSDFILDQACITPQGSSTSYADAVSEAFGYEYLQNILKNLSELEFRRSDSGKPLHLLDNIWEKKQEVFKISSNLERLAFLNIVDKVAYLMPEKSLNLIEFALNNPSDNNKGLLGEITHEDVKRILPKILQKIGYDLEFFPRCSDLLWNLGKDQQGFPSSTPEHSIRILSDFMDYDPEMPPDFREFLLDQIEFWLKDSNAFEYRYSPLDILDPIFKKEGESATAKGRNISITRYYVNYNAVKNDREKALSILSKLTSSNSPKILIRTLKSLFTALTPPLGLKEHESSQERYKQWIAEQLSVLKIISNLVNTNKNPIIFIEISSSLNFFIWQQQSADYEKEIVEKAENILKLIPDSFDTRLMRALLYRYDRHWDVEYDKGIEQNDQELRKTSQEFLDQFTDVESVFTKLECILGEINQIQHEGKASRFLHYLTVQDQTLALGLAEKIIETPTSQISAYIDALLSNIRQKDTEKGIQLIKSTLALNSVNLNRQIAFGYSCRWWESGIHKKDLENIKQLLLTEDSPTKAYTIESMRFFPEEMKRQAIDLLLEIEIGDDRRLADALGQTLNSQFGINLSNITDEQLTRILSKLVRVNTLRMDSHGEGLSIRNFIGECSNRIPEEVVNFILQRIAMAENKTIPRCNDFEPLPYDGLHEIFKGIVNSHNYENILRTIRDSLLEQKSKNYEYWISHLYAYISDNFSDTSLRVLSEWLDSDDDERILKVGTLLESASTNILLSHSEFISKIIEKSYGISLGCYEQILSRLLKIRYSEVRSGFAGEPFPQDVKIRDMAIEIAQRYPKGSPTEKFYRGLSESAKKDIEYQLKMEEEFEQ